MQPRKPLVSSDTLHETDRLLMQDFEPVKHEARQRLDQLSRHVDECYRKKAVELRNKARNRYLSASAGGLLAALITVNDIELFTVSVTAATLFVGAIGAFNLHERNCLQFEFSEFNKRLDKQALVYRTSAASDTL